MIFWVFLSRNCPPRLSFYAGAPSGTCFLLGLPPFFAFSRARFAFFSLFLAPAMACCAARWAATMTSFSAVTITSKTLRGAFFSTLALIAVLRVRGQVTPGPEGNSKCTGEVTPGIEEGKEAGAASAMGRARSECATHSAVIEGKVGRGLSAQRIYQDLVGEHGFEASYQSVKRYVAKLKAREPKRVWRIESEAGEEVQVDFGLGAMIAGSEGLRKRSWVLRMVLSYSRKAYSEAVMRQDTETFLRCLENGFRHFGGVPAVLNLDNLKAAVLKADWYDPEINPKLAEFCRHYGVSVVPCRPATPEHKGKVESGVKYVRTNALKGRDFESVGEENVHLAHWETNVADKRIHGTTCKQVGALFEEERAHLQPLPASLFPSYQEAQRTVGRDSFVEVARSFYEVPPEYIGNRVWVRWDGRVVSSASSMIGRSRCRCTHAWSPESSAARSDAGG